MLNMIIILGMIAGTFITGFLLDPIIPLCADMREAKEFIMFLVAASIAYYGLRHYSLQCKNRWPLIFLFYTIFTLSIHPPFRLILWGHNICGFWTYAVVFKMIIYYLMYLTVANAPMDMPPPQGNIPGNLSAHRIFKAIFYCGFFSALYIFVQALGCDQLFALRPHDIVLESTKPYLTAFMGQNTFAGALIAACLPFGFYLRKYFFMALMVVAILLIMSKMAIAAAVVGLLFYGMLRSYDYRIHFFMAGMVLALAGVLFLHQHKIQDNGRFSHWTSVYSDFNSPQITDTVPENGSPAYKEAVEVNNKRIWTLTGIGPGSYPYVYVVKHKSIWQEIHNEYGEVLYGWGFCGEVLFLIMCGSFMFIGIWYSKDLPVAVLASSLLILLMCAATFPGLYLSH